MIGSGRFRLTLPADGDIKTILAQTQIEFGTRQQDAYAALIASAIELVAHEPMRFGSKDRSEMRAGLRSFPLALAARRRRAAAHVLYYRIAAPSFDGIEIVRVLHQSMEPRAHLPEALG